jgi:7-carboxy-7-deazaguanine synthase
MYQVNDIYDSIQGEGVLTGVPMVILRLHGCAVGCPFCDTKQTWLAAPQHRRSSLPEVLGDSPLYCEASPSEIAHYLRTYYGHMKWVLLTGGEPAQADLLGLVNALHDAGYRVALETSGTAIGHLHAPVDWVCVSPKIDMPGGLPVLPEVVHGADEIKFVVGKAADLDKLTELLNRCTLKPNAQVCLQPMSTNERATRLCIQTVMEKGNWRLSLQTHKFVNLR